MRRLFVLLAVLMLAIGWAGATDLADYSATTSLKVNITPSMGAQTDYQLKFTLSNSSGISNYYAPDNVVYTNGTTRPDWYDINVTDSADTPLPFWIENNTATAYNATAWVKVPTIAVDNSSGVKWRFGNSSQSASTASMINTFPLGDDFITPSINTTQWVSSGTNSIANGIMTSTSAGAGASYLVGKYNTYGYNHSVTTFTKFQSTSYTGHNIGFSNNDITNLLAFTSRVASGAGTRGRATTSSTVYTSDLSTSNPTAAYERREVIRTDGSTGLFYINNALVATLSNAEVPDNAMTAIIGDWEDTGSNADIYFDWVFVRKAVATEPTTSLYTTSSSAAGEPLTSAFTASANPSTTGAAVSFTDASTGSPVTWNWTIDGSITNTTQNVAYTFASFGTYPINLNVTNATGHFSDVTINQVVTNVTSFTQQDIYLTGQYTITFNVKSSTTNLPIANVTVVDSVSGQSYPSTNGTAFLTEPAGLIYVNFIADGYQSKQVTYVVDQDETHEVKMVPSEIPNNPIYNVYPPKDVKFHITSFFGSPISNATVTIQGITTSTGNWDWFVTLLGISLDEVAINGTAMSESTDSNGDAVFLMLPSVKYNITTTASGYTFPTSFIAPQATEYTITANWNESWFSSGNDTLKDVNVSVSWVKYNDTHSFVNITYDDQTMTTTGGTITVYRDSVSRVANASAISTMDITSSSCSNSTFVETPTGGASYRVLVNATTTDQNIMRTFTHYFKGAPVTLPGWTSETLLWLALFIVIFTAAFAGAIHSPQMAIVLCVESWVFWAIGWLDALITQFWYGETAIIGVLVLASFLAVLWNITEGKSKVKRSS